MDNRKLVSWRLEKLEQNQQDMINHWLDAQSNIQLSLTNMALHMIGHFGYVDIMNFSVQKELYTKLEAVPFEPPIIPIPTQKPESIKESKVEKKKPISMPTVVTEPLSQSVVEQKPAPIVEKPPIEPKKVEEPSDDLYGGLEDDL